MASVFFHQITPIKGTKCRQRCRGDPFDCPGNRGSVGYAGFGHRVSKLSHTTLTVSDQSSPSDPSMLTK